MNSNEDLYELALRAVTTPLLDAYEIRVVLQDMLLERGLVAELAEAESWIAREVKPKPLAEEGSWDIEITGTEVRHDEYRGSCCIVGFRREGQTRVNSYVVSRFDSASALGLVLKAGRGHLETKAIQTKTGRTFMHHTWSEV